ncbi:hypothetical protein J4225_03640 [Candidatus Pacearchaeota archaeon]|nr:hypothetical protein [Candidatus Pacearchaeota archaeon]
MLKIKTQKNKKAQLKIQQMAFMLIAVTLFFALAGLFALGIGLSSLKRSATTLAENDAMLLITKLANSPEFSCGQAFEGESNCIDFDKILALKNHINDYRGFWKVTEISLRILYPKHEGADIECNQGNVNICNIIYIYSRNVDAKEGEKSNFVALCRKENFEGQVYDKCEIAKLIVSYENIEQRE